MSLSNEQRSRLAATAQERGLDPAKLIAAAERLSSGQPPANGGEPAAGESTDAKPAKGAAPAKTDRPLYMYHLPFVTVNEVRETWLGLGPIAGGDMNAAKYAAEQAGPVPPKPDDSAA